MGGDRGLPSQVRARRAASAVLMAGLAATLAACGGATAVPKDTTPPAVVSVSPAAEATGVRQDAVIAFTFSEPMDRASTQAAYQSADLNAAGVTFAWNSAGTVMSVKPNAPLTYATGAATPARAYAFKLTDTAHDLAGNPLAAFSAGFTTLRDITTELALQAEASGFVDSLRDVGPLPPTMFVGDGLRNDSYRSYLSFDLTAIPAGVAPAGVIAATLRVLHLSTTGSPFAALNDCLSALCAPFTYVHLDSVRYGATLEAVTYLAPALRALSPLDYRITADNAWLTDDVLAALRDDLATGAGRSQYRLSFPIETNGDLTDDYVVYDRTAPNLPGLSVEHQIP